MKILGIETSCDETAVGIVQDSKILLSNTVYSSMDLHAKYGGVVPEIAARSHLEVMISVIQESLKISQTNWNEIDGIAVTYGAGLTGSLLMGVSTAKVLAKIFNKPLYGVNHVMGHIYANFLISSRIQGYKLPKEIPKFPLLAIVISGGHTQLAIFNNFFDYRLIGKTNDDAIGEAFDKVAKMLGLPYPGGVEVSLLALKGDKYHYKLPIAKTIGFDFSFSGLKTAVLRLAQKEIGEDFNFPSYKLSERLSELQKANIAASFQYTAALSILNKSKKAIQEFHPNNILLGGGVAANQELREVLSSNLNVPVKYPDIKLCTDNGAMIATIGSYMKNYGLPSIEPFKLEADSNLKM